VVLAGTGAALLYCLLAGWGVPAQRTFVMLLVVALALWLNRLTRSSHILALAALAVIALDPWAVMAPGFWLSFFAVAMIMLVAQRAPLQDSAWDWRSRLAQAGKIQIAITLGLAPLTLLLFQQVSIIGPVANAVAIPLVSFLITPLALLGAALAIWLPFPQLLEFAHALFSWLMMFLEWLTHWRWAVWMAPTPSFAAFALALLGSVAFVAPRSDAWPRLWQWRWLALLAWLPMFFGKASQPAAGEVWLTAFDIGQGMALLVETAGHRLLYDTGPQYSPESDGGSRVLLPYLRARGIHELDVMMVSHQDNDHSGGALSVLRGVKVKQTVSSLAREHAIVRASTQHVDCSEGQQWQWDGVTFAVLHPDPATTAHENLKPNVRSCVLQIRSAAGSALLAGDIEAPQEKRLVAEYGERLRSDILLAPHHGSGTSSTQQFLLQVQPRIALFQVGYLNRYRHPKREVWERYGQLKVARERTDDAGALLVRWSPTAPMQLQRYRQRHARYWYPLSAQLPESFGHQSGSYGGVLIP
jgi:competence protein ComEC